MILIVGLVASLQMGFLPGFLMLKLLRLPSPTKARTLVFSFYLSYLANYLLACVLTYAGLFTASTIWLVVAFELTAFVWVVTSRPKEVRIFIPRPDLNWLSTAARGLNFFNLVAAALGMAAVFYFLLVSFRLTGTIFNHQDEIGSYNNWALMWIRNRMPDAIHTMGYPVSLSANWAISYLLLGTEIQFFAKFVTSFFPFSAALLLFDDGIRRRSPLPLLSAFIFFLILASYVPHLIGQGPLDIAVGCIAVSCLAVGADAFSDRQNGRNLVLLALLGACAATLKQSGLFLVLGGAAFSWYWLHFVTTDLSAAEKKRLAVVVVLIGVLFSLSWYARIQWMIYQGLAVSESTYLTKGIHGGLDYAARIEKAFAMIFGEWPTFQHPKKLKFLFAAICILSCSLSSLRRPARNLIFFAVLPYFTLWLFFFSYEIRTLAPVFPLIAICASTGCFVFLEFLARILRQPYREKLPLFSVRSYSIPLALQAALPIGLFLFAAMLGFTVFPDQQIRQAHLALQRKILDPELNAKLYDANEHMAFTGKIASLYGVLKFLPDLKQYYFKLRVPLSLELLQALEEREDIHYLLMSTDLSISIYGYSMTESAALEHVKQRLASGKFHEIFRHQNLSLIKIR